MQARCSQIALRRRVGSGMMRGTAEVNGMGLLEGKRALVVGVGNQRSIAWGIATAFQREGAQLAFSYLGDRFKENVEKLVATLPGHEQMPLIDADISKPDQLAHLMDEVGKR